MFKREVCDPCGVLANRELRSEGFVLRMIEIDDRTVQRPEDLRVESVAVHAVDDAAIGLPMADLLLQSGCRGRVVEGEEHPVLVACEIVDAVDKAGPGVARRRLDEKDSLHGSDYIISCERLDI